MMSVAPVASAGDAAGYYMHSDNYYFLGNLQSVWLGEGAKALGLEGDVRGDNLTAVLRGFLDNGERLGREVDGKHVHRPGHDLTFSAPKSVSVLALIGGDKAILEAHNHAVQIAAGYVEKLISARDTKDGVTSIVPSGKMVAAAFTHDTSRNLDPQLHTHLIVANMTELGGKWKALATDYIHNAGFIETVMKMQVTLGKIYRNALREQVEALGHEVEEVGPHGMWEIKGVPEEVRDEFSSRGKEIQGAVGAEATLRSRDVAAKDTRQAKRGPSRLRLMERWTQQMQDKGFDLHEYMDTASARAAPRYADDREHGRNERAEISDAVMMAVSHLSDSKTRFTWGELMLATTEFSDRLPDVDSLKQSIDVALKEGIIIPLDSEKGVFTSRIHLLDELSIQALGKEHLQSGQVVSFSRDAPPTTGPLKPVDKGALVLINAPSGVAGIRELTQNLVQNSIGRGRDVMVMASSAERALSLGKSDELKDRIVRRPQLLDGNLSLKPQSTLIIEGAERLGLKETLILLGEAREKDAQLIFLDSAGRQANGNAMSVLESAGVTRTRYNLSSSGLEASVLSIADKRGRYAALASRYASLNSRQETVTAVVTGQREQKNLTSLIRDALKDSGQLEQDSITIETRVPVWLDSKTRRMSGSYRVGQVIEDRSDAKETHHYIIDRVHDDTRMLSLIDKDGVVVRQKLSAMTKDWRLYEREHISISGGEKLIAVAADKSTGLKAKDRLTVTTVSETALTVERNGKVVTLPSDQPLYVVHGYVTSPGGRDNDTGTVLAALNTREITAQTMNSLAQSGDCAEIFTSETVERAELRLQRMRGSSSPVQLVRRLADREDTSEALTTLQQNIKTDAALALSRAMLRFTATARELGQTGNAKYSVSEVRENGELVLLGENGRKLIQPAAVRAEQHIDYGWAVTGYGAQGTSRDYVISLEGTDEGRRGLATLRAFYITASRAKEHVQIYTDGLSKWLNAVKTPDKELKTAHDALKPETQRQQAKAIWSMGQPPGRTAIGRAWLKHQGLSDESLTMKVIPATRRHPEPALAMRLFDQNGKNAGLALVSLVASDTGRLTQGETRMLATDGVQGAILQRSRSGNTRVVGTFAEALDTVRHFPQDGVVWQTGEVRPSSSLLRLTRGADSGLEVRSALAATDHDPAMTFPDLTIKDATPEAGITISRETESEKEAAASVIELTRDTVQKPASSDVDIGVVSRLDGELASQDAQYEQERVKSVSEQASPAIPNTDRLLAERQQVIQAASELADRDASEAADTRSLREQGRMPEVNEPDITRTIQKER